MFATRRPPASSENPAQAKPRAAARRAGTPQDALGAGHLARRVPRLAWGDPGAIWADWSDLQRITRPE